MIGCFRLLGEQHLSINGPVNAVLGVFGLGPFNILNTSGAVVLGMVYNYVPYMILPLYTSMTKIDQSLVEACLLYTSQLRDLIHKAVRCKIRSGVADDEQITVLRDGAGEQIQRLGKMCIRDRWCSSP